MTLPVQDPFWTETADFIHRAIGPDAPFIGPRELAPHLPRVFPYDWVHAVDVLHDYKGIAVHKGLMNELPVPVLRMMEQEWKCVFANAVFLFFMPPSCPLTVVSGEHLQTFLDNLVALEKLETAKKLYFSEATACVVLARGAHTGLEATLHSLSLLHLEVVVVPVTGDANQREACRDLCARYRAGIIEEPGANSIPPPAEAIKTGVKRLLAEEKNTWIASFDDSVIVRPDFLAVMEKWSDPEERPLLGGYWEEADGVRESFQRDGFHMIIPERPNARFLYGHRDYWTRRFDLAPGKENRASSPPRNWLSRPLEALVIPGLVLPQGEAPCPVATPQPAR